MAIKTETLIDIAKHGNKVTKLARFFDEADAKLCVNNILMLNGEQTPLDILDAFEKDLSETASLWQSISIILADADENGYSNELGCNLKEIFGDKFYVTEVGVKGVELFGNKITERHRDSKKSDLKYYILKNIFGYDFDTKSYDLHLKSMRKLAKADISKDSHISDKLIYANAIQGINKYQFIYDKILGMSEDHKKVLMTLNFKERQLIDEKIKFTRATAYSVAKTSTYIKRDGGIVQSSSKHDPNIIKKVAKLFEEIPHLSAIEIDQDASIEKIESLLIDFKAMNFDTSEMFEFKIRKLGNYGFKGVSSVLQSSEGVNDPFMRIVAVDLKYPTSIAHELTHFRDIDRSPSNELREYMVSFGLNKMQRFMVKNGGSGVDPDYLDYLTNPAEIIARLGEIGYLFNKFDIPRDFTVEQMREHVNSAMESLPMLDKKYDVFIMKKIDEYLENRLAYFDLENWTPEEISMVKDYTREFFYSNEKRYREELIKKLKENKLPSVTYDSTRYNKRVTSRRELTDIEKIKKAMGVIDPESLHEVYRVLKEKNLLEPEEFPLVINNTFTSLGAGASLAKQKRVAISTIIGALNGLAKTIDVAAQRGDKEEAVAIAMSALAKMGVSSIPNRLIDAPNLKLSKTFKLMEGYDFIENKRILPETYAKNPNSYFQIAKIHKEARDQILSYISEFLIKVDNLIDDHEFDPKEIIHLSDHFYRGLSGLLKHIGYQALSERLGYELKESPVNTDLNTMMRSVHQAHLKYLALSQVKDIIVKNTEGQLSFYSMMYRQPETAQIIKDIEKANPLASRPFLVNFLKSHDEEFKGKITVDKIEELIKKIGDDIFVQQDEYSPQALFEKIKMSIEDEDTFAPMAITSHLMDAMKKDGLINENKRKVVSAVADLFETEQKIYRYDDILREAEQKAISSASLNRKIGDSTLSTLAGVGELDISLNDYVSYNLRNLLFNTPDSQAFYESGRIHKKIGFSELMSDNSIGYDSFGVIALNSSPRKVVLTVKPIIKAIDNKMAELREMIIPLVERQSKENYKSVYEKSKGFYQIFGESFKDLLLADECLSIKNEITSKEKKDILCAARDCLFAYPEFNPHLKTLVDGNSIHNVLTQLEIEQVEEQAQKIKNETKNKVELNNKATIESKSEVEVKKDKEPPKPPLTKAQQLSLF
jgi:hypothetical protein